MRRRAIGLLSAVLLLAAFVTGLPVSQAQDLRDGYKIRLVLHVERNRLLTDVFKQQVASELRDGVQAALGDLARIEVTDTHPKLLEIRRDGLGKALDGLRERSEYQTHFVLIDYTGTHYQIETRSHDGLTGLTSPSVRKGRTRDRAYVAHTAALLLKADIGLLGTVISDPDGQKQVQVQMRGGGLGVDLSRWVKKGDVFALIRVSGNGPGERIPFAVLQTLEPPRQGVLTAKLSSRFVLNRTTGLRAVLLGTRTAPLRLRLMQEKRGGGAIPLEAAVTIQIRRNGFDGEDGTRVQMTASPGRDVDTSKLGERGEFTGLAFVTVLTGTNIRARIPVPVVDNNYQVLVVPVSNDEGDLLSYRYQDLQRAVIDAYAVQNDQFAIINKLSSDPEKRKEAIARVRNTIKRSQEDYLTFTEQREEFLKQIARLPEKDRPSLKIIDDRMALLKAGENDLLKHVALLEKIDKEENDPTRKEWKIKFEQAKLLEKDGDIDKAIEIYEKAPEEFQTDAQKKYLENLKARWKPVDEEHEKARKFIYDSWATLDTASLKEQLSVAREALATCKKHDDVIGVNRLIRGTDTIITRMEKELGDLKPGVNPDDDKPAERIKELTPELKKIYEDARAFLKDKSKE